MLSLITITRNRMRSHRLYSVAAIVALAMVLTPAGSIASNASATSDPTIVSGTLLDSSGHPAAGHVMLQAEPAPSQLPVSIGAKVSYVAVTGLTKTASNGTYHFTQSQLTGSPAAARLKSLAAANNGWVNYMIVGTTASSSGQYFFPRRLTSTGWSAAGHAITVNVRASQALSQADRSGIAHYLATPQDVPPGCYAQATAEQAHWTRIGETHRWWYATSSFHYGRTADSDIQVKASATDSGYAGSGYVHIANSLGSSYSVPQLYTLYGQRMLTKFDYTKFAWVWNGVGSNLCHGHFVQSTKWIGGMHRGTRLLSTRDGRCQYRPSMYRTTLPSHSYFTFRHAQGTWYGAAANAFSLELAASSGLSTDVSTTIHAVTRSEYYCGEYGNKVPSESGSIAVGRSF